MKVMVIIFLVLASLMAITIMTQVIMEMICKFREEKKRKEAELEQKREQFEQDILDQDSRRA